LRFLEEYVVFGGLSLSALMTHQRK